MCQALLVFMTSPVRYVSDPSTVSSWGERGRAARALSRSGVLSSTSSAVVRARRKFTGSALPLRRRHEAAELRESCPFSRRLPRRYGGAGESGHVSPSRANVPQVLNRGRLQHVSTLLPGQDTRDCNRWLWP